MQKLSNFYEHHNLLFVRSILKVNSYSKFKFLKSLNIKMRLEEIKDTQVLVRRKHLFVNLFPLPLSWEYVARRRPVRFSLVDLAIFYNFNMIDLSPFFVSIFGVIKGEI